MLVMWLGHHRLWIIERYIVRSFIIAQPYIYDEGRCRAKIFPAAKIFPPPWLYRLYYPLCVSRRIDTWQIVYLPNKDPCPKISIRKSEIKVH